MNKISPIGRIFRQMNSSSASSRDKLARFSNSCCLLASRDNVQEINHKTKRSRLKRLVKKRSW
ncbi:MAG: hypothetical protein ACFFD4_11330 [Candidatus Odinarchaeota archaeon]